LRLKVAGTVARGPATYRGGIRRRAPARTALHDPGPPLTRMLKLVTLVGPLAVAALLAAPTTPVGAQQRPLHRVRVAPARPDPGVLVQVTVRPDSALRDGVREVTGTLAGEPLHFERRDDGSWVALGGVPTSAADGLTLPVVLARADGTRDSLQTTGGTATVVARVAGEQLRVAGRYGRAPDSALAARMARAAARALAVGRASHDTPRLWRATFLRPREARVTSRFGSGRTFNGAVQAQHGGVDYAGAVGAPVRAANRGVVALVDTFHLAGRAIYVDHGAGVVTGYFHLSEALVAPGDTVARGQRIGRVGATGRVTGPHLHWMARYGTVTVNPAGLLALPARPAPSAPARAADDGAAGAPRTTAPRARRVADLRGARYGVITTLR
jgi:murein DD-endopeptidase MepM/ murein hydrolase activator NlpD